MENSDFFLPIFLEKSHEIYTLNTRISCNPYQTSDCSNSACLFIIIIFVANERLNHQIYHRFLVVVSTCTHNGVFTHRSKCWSHSLNALPNTMNLFIFTRSLLLYYGGFLVSNTSNFDIKKIPSHCFERFFIILVSSSFFYDFLFQHKRFANLGIECVLFNAYLHMRHEHWRNKIYETFTITNVNDII